MALPTIVVTPGSGQTINTLPNAPQFTASSVAVAIASDQSAAPVGIASGASTYQETTITVGGTAQNLFSGATPPNGYEILNISPTELLYWREAAAAVVGGASSGAISPRGAYTSPTGYKPSGAISVNAATPAHPIIARSF